MFQKIKKSIYIFRLFSFVLFLFYYYSNSFDVIYQIYTYVNRMKHIKQAT